MSIKEENLRKCLKQQVSHHPHGFGSCEYTYSIPVDHQCKKSKINCGQQRNHGRVLKDPEYQSKSVSQEVQRYVDHSGYGAGSKTTGMK